VHRGGFFSPRALSVVPDSERMIRAVLDDNRFAPSAPVQRLGPRPESPGLHASGPSRCEPWPGGLFWGGPVAAVMRVGEWAPDRTRMQEPVPPSLPFWYLLFPQSRGLPAGFVPRPRLSCGPSCSDGLPSSESAAPRFSRPVPSRRCRGGVRAARADRVRTLVGREPASPDAACPVGGAVVGVMGPGRPDSDSEGRWVVHASSHPGPVDKASQRRVGDQGEIRRRETRVQRGVIVPLRFTLMVPCLVPGFPS
jgi:hypothetical protein